MSSTSGRDEFREWARRNRFRETEPRLSFRSHGLDVKRFSYYAQDIRWERNPTGNATERRVISEKPSNIVVEVAETKLCSTRARPITFVHLSGFRNPRRFVDASISAFYIRTCGKHLAARGWLHMPSELVPPAFAARARAGESRNRRYPVRWAR